jgi:hypothetical protein
MILCKHIRGSDGIPSPLYHHVILTGEPTGSGLGIPAGLCWLCHETRINGPNGLSRQGCKVPPKGHIAT